MNITRYITIGAILIMAFVWAGCGSTSAPPVDLPAPITGRVDVSAPDADGNVTITGSEGAVTGDNIVMVVNENVAGAVTQQIMDMLISNAYAGDLPSICSEPGHACTMSASDGSFTLIIAASVGDSLVIGLIDESGAFISELLRTDVPQSGEPEPGTNCSTEGVSGAVVDIKIIPSSGTPVMLKQGSATTTNQLVIGATSPTTVAISGCHAHSLDIYYTAMGNMIAVTSKDDKILWAARIVSDQVKDSRHFSLSYEPMHIAYVDLPTQPIVALDVGSTVKLAKVSTSDGTISNEMSLYQGGTTLVSGLTRSTALDIYYMGSTYGHYLGLLITDTGNNTNSYITLFQADGLVHKATFSRTEINNANLPPFAESFVNGIIYKVGTNPVMALALLDSGGAVNYLRRYGIEVAPAKALYYDQDLENYTTLSQPMREFELPWASGTMQNIVLSESMIGEPRAIMSDANGNLLEQFLGSGLPIQPVSVWTSGHDIVAIDLCDELMKLFGADATDETILDRSEAIDWL
ncbi:MAG: hypothetical protein ABH871_02115 [Pseudomonadota bacterium]